MVWPRRWTSSFQRGAVMSRASWTTGGSASATSGELARCRAKSWSRRTTWAPSVAAVSRVRRFSWRSRGTSPNFDQLHLAQDRRQHVIQIVRDPRRHLAEPAELLGADELRLGRLQARVRIVQLREEAGVLDGDGRLGGKRGEVGQLGRAERFGGRGVKGEHPKDLGPARDGQAKIGLHAEGAVPRGLEVPRVLGTLRDVQGLAGSDHVGGEPPVEGERLAREVRRPAGRADAEDAGGPVEQQDLDVRGPRDAVRLGHNPVQDCLEIQAGHDGARRGEERLQFGPPPHGGLVEPGVFDGNRGLRGEEADDAPDPPR